MARMPVKFICDNALHLKLVLIISLGSVGFWIACKCAAIVWNIPEDGENLKGRGNIIGNELTRAQFTLSKP